MDNSPPTPSSQWAPSWCPYLSASDPAEWWRHTESIILLPLSVLDTQAESVSSQLRKSSCPPYRYSWFYFILFLKNLGPGQSHESVSKWVKLKGTAGLFFQPLFQTVSADVAFLWVNRDMIPATSCVSCTCTGIKSVADRRRCFAKGFFFFLLKLQQHWNC